MELSKSFTANVVFKAISETPEGWIISGPVASLKRDYDGETMERAGILKGLKMFFNLGAHIDYNHRVSEEEAKGNPNALDYMIGKGLRVEEVKGVPHLVGMLFKSNDKAGQLAASIVKALKRGVRFGFSIEGLASKHPDDDSRIVSTQIHRITIAPSTKGFDQWVRLGADDARIVKAIESVDEEPSFDCDMVEVLKAIRSDDGWEPVEKAAKPEAEDASCPTCGDPTCAHREAYHQGFVAGALKLSPFHMDEGSKETLTAPTDPRTLDRATTSHSYAAGHQTGSRYREVYKDDFEAATDQDSAMSPDPKAAQRKAEHTLAAHLHTSIIPTFFQRWGLEQANADRCPECGSPGGGSKVAKPTSSRKAVVAEAKQCCPKCQRQMYCLTCHRTAGQPVKKASAPVPPVKTNKAMMTGEGVVQGGDTGGRALRSQALRDKSSRGKACRNCGGPAVEGICKACDDCDAMDATQAGVMKSLKLSGMDPIRARAVAVAAARLMQPKRR